MIFPSEESAGAGTGIEAVELWVQMIVDVYPC